MPVSAELAQQLRNAGFPQALAWGKFAYREHILCICTRKGADKRDNEADPSDNDLVFAPTPSDLISGLGHHFASLSCGDDDAFTVAIYVSGNPITVPGEYLAPEIALAFAYLTVHTVSI